MTRVSRMTRVARLRALLALLVVAAASAGACNIAAPAFYILHGPPRTPAVYTLADRPTVIFVDDRANAIPRQPDAMRRLLDDEASRQLMEKKVLSNTIRPQDEISVARRHDRYSDVLSIGAIGEAVGAEQVIYVQMIEFRETPDGFTPRPQGACEVKVIDVANQARLFPPPDAPTPSHAVRVLLPAVNEELYKSNPGRLQIYRTLAGEMGSEIAKLFYEHETKELGGQLEAP
jgi:hypothetical protein